MSPPTLCDYLSQRGRNFMRRPETYAELLVRLLQADHEVAFVSLNYDTLLEQAIAGLPGGGREFFRMSGYVLQTPLVVKPRGSVDWARLYSRAEDESFEDCLNNLGSRPRAERSTGHLSVYDFHGRCRDTAQAWMRSEGG